MWRPYISWVIDENGNLYITGEGIIPDYDHDHLGNIAPWMKFARFIRSVKIGHGITSIGSRAFCNCSLLSEVTIPDSVTSIGGIPFRIRNRQYCYS